MAAENMNDTNINDAIPTQPLPDELFQRYYQIMTQHENIFKSIVQNLEVWRPGLYGWGERHEVPTWTGIQDQLAGSEIYMLSKVMNAHDYVEHHVADHELGTPEDFNDIRELPTGRYVWNPETNRHDIIEECVDEQRHDIPQHYTHGIYNWVPDHENHRWVKTQGRFRVWRGEGTEPIDRYHVVKHVPRFVQHLIYGEGDRIGLRVRSSENQKSFQDVSTPDDHHNSYSRNPEDIRGQLMLHSGASVTWEHEAVFRMSNDTDFKMTERSSLRMSQNALQIATDATRHEMHHHAYSRMTESSWFAMSENARFRMSDWAWARMHDRTSIYMTDTANLEMRNNSRQAFSEDSIVVMRGNEYKGKNQYANHDDRPHECIGWDDHPDKWFNPHETENINIINHDNYRFDSHGDHRRGTLPPADHLSKMWPEYTVYPHAYTRGGARYVTKTDPVTQDSVVIGYEGSMSGTTGHNVNHVDPNLWYKDEKGRWVVNNSAVDLKVPWNWNNPAVGSTPNIRNTGPDWKGSPWLYMVGEPQIQMRIRAELFMTQDSSINMIHTSRFHTRNDSRMIMRGGDTWYNREGFNTSIDTPTKRYFESNPISYTAQCVPYKYYLDGEETIGWNGVYVEDATTYAPNRNVPRTLYELPPEDRYYAGSPWLYFAGQPRLQMRNQADVFMTENTTISMWHKARTHLRNSSNLIMRGSSDNEIGRWIDRRTPTTIDSLTGLPIAKYAKPYKYYVTGDIETVGMDGVTSPSHPDSLDTYSNNSDTASVPVAFRNEVGITRWELPDIDRPQPYSPWLYMAGQPRFQMRLNANFFMTEDSKISMWHDSKIHTRNKALIVMRGSDSPTQGRWQHRTSGNATQLIPDKYYIDGMKTIGMDGVTIGSDLLTGSGETHSQNPLITAPNRNTLDVTRWELPWEDRPKPLSPWLYMAGEPRFQMRLRSDLFMTEDTTISMWHNARIHTRNRSSIIMRGSTSDGTNITSGRWLHLGTNPLRLATELVPDKYYIEGPETIGIDGVNRNGDPSTYTDNRNNVGYELPAKDRPQVGSPWVYFAGQPRFQMRLDANFFMTNTSTVSMWHDARIHSRNESRIIMRGGERWRNRAGHMINRPFKYYLDGPETIGVDGVHVEEWETFNVTENHPTATRWELPAYDRPKYDSPWLYMAGQPRFQMRLDANFFMTQNAEVSMWHKARIHTRNEALLVMRGGTRWFDRFATTRATPDKYYQDGPNTIGVDGVSVSDWQTFNVSDNTIEDTRWELPFKDRPKAVSPWLYMAGSPRFHMRRYSDIFMTDNTTISMWHNARFHIRNDSLFVMRGGKRWWNRSGAKIDRPFKYYLDGPETIGEDGVHVQEWETYNVSANHPTNTRWELPFKDRPKANSPWLYLTGQPRLQMRLDADLFMTETSSISMWHDARMHTRNESRIIMRGGTRWRNRMGDLIPVPFKYYLDGMNTIGDNGIDIDGTPTYTANLNDPVKTRFELPFKDRPKAGSPWWYMAGQPRFQMRMNARFFMTEDSQIDMTDKAHVHMRNNANLIMRGSTDGCPDRWYERPGDGPYEEPFKYYMDGPNTIGENGVDVEDPSTWSFTQNTANTLWELPEKDRPKPGSPWQYFAGQPRFQMRMNSDIFMTNDTSISFWHKARIHSRNDSLIVMRGGNRWYDRNGTKLSRPYKYYLDGRNTIGVNGVLVQDSTTFSNDINHAVNTRYELPSKDRPVADSPWLYMAGAPRFQMRLDANFFMTEATSISMWHNSRVHTRNDSLIVMRGGNRWYDRAGGLIPRPFKYYLTGADTVSRDGVDVTNVNNPTENTAITRFELPEKDRPKANSPWMYMAGAPRFQMRLDANFFMTQTSTVSMWHDARIHTRNESRIIQRGGQRWINRTGGARLTPFKQYINGSETIGPDGKTTSYLGVSGTATVNFELPAYDRPKANSPWHYMAGQPRFQMRNQAHFFMTEDTAIDMWHNSLIHTRNDSKIVMRGGSRWITNAGAASTTIAPMGPHMPTGFDRAPNTNRFYFNMNVDNTTLTETSWFNTPLFHIHGNDNELPVIDRWVANSPWFYMAGQPRLQMRANSSLFMTDNSDFRMYNDSKVELSQNSKIDMNTDSHIQGTGSGHLHFTNNPPTYTRLNRVGYEAHLNSKTGTDGRKVLPGQRLLNIGTFITRGHAAAAGISNIGADDLRRPGNYVLSERLNLWNNVPSAQNPNPTQNPNPGCMSVVDSSITNLTALWTRKQANIATLSNLTHSFSRILPQFNHITHDGYHDNTRRNHLEVMAHSYDGEPNIDLIQRLTSAPHDFNAPTWLDSNHRLLGHFNRPMMFLRSWNRNAWTPWVKLLDSMDRFDASIIQTGILPIERGGNSRNTIQRGEMFYAHSETTNLVDPSKFTGNFTTIDAPVVTRSAESHLHNRNVSVSEQVAPITPEKALQSFSRNFDFPKILVHNRDNVDLPPEWRDITDATARRRMSFGRNVQSPNTAGSWSNLTDYHRMGVYDLNGTISGGTPFSSLSGNHELTVIKPQAGADGANSTNGITIQRMMTQTGRMFIRSLNGSSIASNQEPRNTLNGWTETTVQYRAGLKITMNNASNTSEPKRIDIVPRDIGAFVNTSTAYDTGGGSQTDSYDPGDHVHRIHVRTNHRVLGVDTAGTVKEISIGTGIIWTGTQIELGTPVTINQKSTLAASTQNVKTGTGGGANTGSGHTHVMEFEDNCVRMKNNKRLYVTPSSGSNTGAQSGDVWIQTG